jgi:hypothetical protein
VWPTREREGGAASQLQEEVLDKLCAQERWEAWLEAWLQSRHLVDDETGVRRRHARHSGPGGPRWSGFHTGR